LKSKESIVAYALSEKETNSSNRLKVSLQRKGGSRAAIYPPWNNPEEGEAKAVMVAKLALVLSGRKASQT